MNIYEFIDSCREDGMTASEALDAWDDYQAERKERFLEGYYNDPMVQYGWYQQDMIDLRRSEQ